MKKVSIIGFGRFGKVLYRLLRDDFEITLFDKAEILDDTEFNENTSIASNLEEVYSSKVIFYAVPIEVFEDVIKDHRRFFRDEHLLIDVLSVKMHPEKVLKKYLKGKKTQAILTHPMFGPDSSKDGFSGLPLVMDRYLADKNNHEFWKNFFKNKGLKIIELSAKEHDQLAANSQGLTHFIGRLLDSYGLKSSPIDTLGTKKLIEVKEQTVNDTWQLFANLQHFNPYTKKMRLKLGQKYDELFNKLLPEQINSDYLTVGIQGGKGSFNQEAVRHYFRKHSDEHYKIKYLYTSENVLSALHKGEIDRGQLAIHNSIGGIVDESVKAMSRYKFKIIKEFAIKISHTLMIRGDANDDEIDTIMTHPQVLAQCKSTLAKKYPNLKKESGKGKLVDHSLVAKRLSEKKLPKNIATMGSSVLAEIYDLKVVDTDLQDAKENYTSFLLVKRI